MMPTLDHSTGLAPGEAALSDGAVQTFFRRFLPDFYFVNTPLSRMRRHLALLRQLPQQPLQTDFYHVPGGRSTELVLCARDEERPGLLSKVAGTLSALRVNVHTAWIHTLDNPHSPSTGHVVLDTLILSETHFRRTRALSEKTQKLVRETLADVFDGRADVDFLLTRAVARRKSALEVFDLSAQEVGAWTLVKIRAEDDPGLLYCITRALARLELDIAHAQINTFDTAADDVFFVTRAGAPLDEAQAPAILEQLRHELSGA